MFSKVVSFLIIVAVVVFGSVISSRLWKGKAEKMPESVKVVVEDGMTIGQFGGKYGLEKKQMKKMFGLTGPGDLKKPVGESGYTPQQLNKIVNRALAMQAEHSSKNWFKIPLKGGLWVIFLVAVYQMLRRGKITAKNRKIIYAAAVVVFGIILGSDPSPMGTVKDAVVLFGAKGIVFPPRLVAFCIFILMTIIANKFICSWGCQLGTLQDLIFRINRNDKDTAGAGQVKVPFVISNTVRILFFIALTAAAFAWSIDIVEHFDPFKIFKPKVLGIGGGIFIGLILLASLFVYRPWCHFFCPFGLVSWAAERISFLKVRVDREKCTSCNSCVKACPTKAMEGIMNKDKIKLDCFSCGNCLEVCPVKAVSFGKDKK